MLTARRALSGAFVALAAALPSATALADHASILHVLTKGEKFVYSRVITYRETTGILHERSTITLEVLDTNGATASVRQRISVNGGPEKTRQITAGSDGKWLYSDHNSVAQDFVTWDATQFGRPPVDPQPGQSWELDVPQSAMFAAGHAIVKVVSANGGKVVIDGSGDSGRRDDTILDRDTHKFVPVSVRGRWSVRVTYQDGIVQDFHRDDRVHYNVNRNAAQTDDDVDVAIRLVSHT